MDASTEASGIGERTRGAPALTWKAWVIWEFCAFWVFFVKSQDPRGGFGMRSFHNMFSDVARMPHAEITGAWEVQLEEMARKHKMEETRKKEATWRRPT